MEKLSECQKVLKENLLHSLVCLDFYKDIEAYVQENKFEAQSQEVSKHIDKVEDLIH